MLLRGMLLFSLSFVVAVSCYAQQTPTTSTLPIRDSQAIAILTMSLNTMGGLPAVSTVQDFAETGSISYSWAGKDVAGTVALYGKGTDRFRMTSAMPDGNLNIIINANGGESVGEDGIKRPLPFYDTIAAPSLAFPAARVAAALANASTSLSNQGRVTMDDVEVIKIHVAPQISQDVLPTVDFPNLGEYDAYIDPTTNQIVSISDFVHSDRDNTLAYSREVSYGGYNRISGVDVPFTITQRVSGQRIWTIKLNSVAFNTAVSDATFTF
jgi:hypothetical protein